MVQLLRLEEAGYEVIIAPSFADIFRNNCGNIGVPALDLLDGTADELAVVELSSYQIADLEIAPEVALLTNLFREHLDWHGSEETYRAEKLRILGLPGLRTAVLNLRDPGLSEAASAAEVAVVPYGVPAGWNTRARQRGYRGSAPADRR